MESQFEYDLLEYIIREEKIHFAIFDAGLKLISASDGIETFLVLEKPLQRGDAISDIFSEMVGYEPILEEFAKHKAGPLRIDVVRHRMNGNSDDEISAEGGIRNGYYSFEVASYRENLLVILRDVSDEANQDQEVIQRRNELDLLNGQLIKDLSQVNTELTRAYEKTLEGWAKALELRDLETKGHSERVTRMILRLARAMGIDESTLDNLRYGALLHDVGKMGIPDCILLKPGPLDAIERAIMCRHPEYASEMLESMNHLDGALDIPCCHHEKWDGSGYPNGLKGEEIPLSARLFSVIDVWDALLSDRPYRIAWSREDTVEYIRKNSGTYFDPRVVDAFLRMIDEEGD